MVKVTLCKLHQKQQAASYCFTCKAACLISQSALEDLVDPGWSRSGIAIVVLAVQCAVCEAAVGLFLLPLLLKQICNGVQQVVQELMGILLHVVVKQLCEKGEATRYFYRLRCQETEITGSEIVS